MGVQLFTAPLEILVVEDEPDIADAIAAGLEQHGHRPVTVGNGEAAIEVLRQRAVDVLVCDVRLPGADGLTVLRISKELRPEIPVILMSAYGSIAEAVEAVKRDACHYLEKPFTMEALLDAVREAGLQVFAAQRAAARRAESHGDIEHAIVGESQAMVALRDLVRSVADADGPVLVTGETGTGKELVAQTIHQLSPRRDQEFVALNCAAFPETLIESELFGHERGAFTGAARKREGLMRRADGGTLFLDEVGEIAVNSQAKLLRALETGSFQPVGSDVAQRVDVRLLSATNADLRGGRFRADLFYRLKMFHVRVPPLRERRSDIPLLVGHFLGRMTGGEPFHLTPRAWSALTHYDYPGNVRELRNALGHAVAMARGDDLDVKHLPLEFRGGEAEPGASADSLQTLELAGRAFERDYLLRTLDAAEWNKTRAAAILGISRKTLWKKLRDLHIED